VARAAFVDDLLVTLFHDVLQKVGSLLLVCQSQIRTESNLVAQHFCKGEGWSLLYLVSRCAVGVDVVAGEAVVLYLCRRRNFRYHLLSRK